MTDDLERVGRRERRVEASYKELAGIQDGLAAPGLRHAGAGFAGMAAGNGITPRPPCGAAKIRGADAGSFR